jgi:hypothetical protein
MINDPALTRNERAIFAGLIKGTPDRGKVSSCTPYNFPVKSAINDTITGSMMVIYYEEM